VPVLPLPLQALPRDDELPPPHLGEHTVEVLLSAGYDAQQLADLESAGVIITHSDLGTTWAPPRS
jgi:crotonobetainyl-CoA:carnitine CoA-transferase CaiB-like acyl-CoA transferase